MRCVSPAIRGCLLPYPTVLAVLCLGEFLLALRREKLSSNSNDLCSSEVGESSGRAGLLLLCRAAGEEQDLKNSEDVCVCVRV